MNKYIKEIKDKCLKLLLLLIYLCIAFILIIIANKLNQQFVKVSVDNKTIYGDYLVDTKDKTGDNLLFNKGLESIFADDSDYIFTIVKIKENMDNIDNNIIVLDKDNKEIIITNENYNRIKGKIIAKHGDSKYLEYSEKIKDKENEIAYTTKLDLIILAMIIILIISLYRYIYKWR